MLFHQAIEQRLIAAPPYLEGRLREKDEVIADLLTEHIALKKSVWTALNGVWVEPDKRDQIVDFVNGWSKKTRMPIEGILDQVGLAVGKFYDWRKRYGEAHQHNGKVSRDFWLLDWEKQKVLDFQLSYPDLGYRRLTYMMIDADVAAMSPASVWRILDEAGRMRRAAAPGSTKKGTGFEQSVAVHEHWHIDIAHINIHGTFYYLCAVLDGASRFLIAWDLRESMTEREIEVLLERAKERFPDARPRIISDNGPQFIAKDFKEFIRLSGMTHVRTSPYYPQSNGKMERWNKSIRLPFRSLLLSNSPKQISCRPHPRNGDAIAQIEARSLRSLKDTRVRA